MSLACIRGCTRLRRHAADCDQGDDCTGCQARLAEYGHLCKPCHRRLELILTDAPTVHDWLTANLGTTGDAHLRQDFERGESVDGSPAPIKVAVFDLRQRLADVLSEYVNDLCQRHRLVGPDRHTPASDAKYLLTWLDRIEAFEWVGDWWEELADVMTQAHALAPWRPQAQRVNGVACPECGECALTIFGGETIVTCLRCRAVISEDHFGLWEQIIEAEKAAKA